MGSARCSDSSMFRQVNVPTVRYSDSSIFRQIEGFLFRQVDIPTTSYFYQTRYSDSLMFRQLLEGSIFRQVRYSDNDFLKLLFNLLSNELLFFFHPTRKPFLPSFTDIFHIHPSLQIHLFFTLHLILTFLLCSLHHRYFHPVFSFFLQVLIQTLHRRYLFPFCKKFKIHHPSQRFFNFHSPSHKFFSRF